MRLSLLSFIIIGVIGVTPACFAQVDSLVALATDYAHRDLDSSQLIFERAVAECKRLKDDTTLLMISCDYARVINRVPGGHEVALTYLHRAKALKGPSTQHNKFQYRLFREYYATHFAIKANFDSALYYCEKQLTVAPDSSKKALIHNRFGTVYTGLRDMVKALEHFNYALAYQSGPNIHPLDRATVYDNLGTLYEDDGDYERAEKWYLKSAEIQATTNEDKLNAFYTWNNLAILYEHQKRYDESLAMMAKAEAMLPDLDGDLRAKAMVEINIGNTLVHAGRAAESVTRFKNGIMYADQVDDNNGSVIAHRQLAEAYNKLGRYREAERQAFHTIRLAKQYGFEDLVTDAYHDLYESYAGLKQYENAYKYQNLFHQRTDSLDSQSKRNKVGLLEKTYELSQQERARAKLERENELHVIQAKVDNVTRVSLISGLVVLGFVAFGFVVAYRQSRDRNRLLAEQKQKIEDQASQLQEAANAKARFFTNVSHELRTPVTLLSGMLELMQESGNAQHLKDKMDIALGSSRRLQYLVGEVLDLSRLDSAKVQLNKKTVEVYPLLTRILYAFESLFIRKNIQLKYDGDSLRNIFVEIDVDKFEKVINNLVFNALKFNREGGWINVTGRISGESMVIDIADSGIGIPEKDIPHIFERFYQGPAPNNIDGIGVGLSLVREFTVLHGGNVSVASKLGEGTTFTLTFPLGETSAIHAEEASALPDVNLAEFEKATVLIVEDNDEMRFYLREILGTGITVLEARNGREALKHLDAHTPDLIISDVMMPEMDGNELVKHLKASEAWKRIPIVVLTARAAEDDLLHFLGFGVDDYIIKPFNARELKIRIRNLLTNQALRRQWNARPIEEEEHEAAPTETNVFLKTVREFVESNISNPNPGIGELADHMAMSERQLYRRCGAVAGMTPAHLIKDIKLDIAWQRLVSKKVTKVSELAHSLGYENISYFSRLFSERYGKRPADFL